LLAILLINAAVTRSRLDVQDSNQGWVEHTQRVQLELTTVESLLKDAETGQRGYLYTGEARYLEPYNTAVQQIDSHIASLAELVTDNPKQLSRVVTLRSLSKVKLEELATTIALYGENRRDEARAIVLSDMGRRTMENLRSLMAEMSRDESSLEAARLAAVRSSTTSLVRTLYLATALAAMGLMLLAFDILREMDQREKHAAEIRQREEWFRVTLGSIGDAVIATYEQ